VNLNNKTKVYWTAGKDRGNLITPEDITYFAPIPVYDEIFSKRKNTVGIEKCPAIKEMCKNTYAIKAPYDLTLEVTNDGGFNTSVSRDFFESLCNWRGNVGNGTDIYSATLPPSYLFYSKSSVKIESIPAFLQSNKSIENVNLIPGTFNIGKWIRPLDFTIEIKNPKDPVTIKRGDIIFYVRFITEDGSKVELERSNDNSIHEVSFTCTSVKERIRNLTLPKLYEMAEGYINSFWKTK